MQPRFSRLSLITPTALATALLCLGSAASAQEDGSLVQATAARQKVKIEFVPTVGDTPVSCNSTLKGLGTTKVRAKLQDLRFYVSNLTLVKVVNGVEVEEKVTLHTNDYQLNSGENTVALVDLENGAGLCAGTSARHPFISGTVPAGTYTKVKWTLGVPEALNHTLAATAPAPLNNTSMAWSWQSGRKFIKIEVNPLNNTTKTYAQGITKYDSAGAATGTYNDSFYFHLGNTGCSVNASSANGYSCTSDNTLPLHIHGFDYNTQRIAVDLKALFAKNNLQQEHGGAPGCMSSGTDPECVALWGAIGSSFVSQTTSSGSTILVSTHDDSDEFFHGHTVFRKIAK